MATTTVTVDFNTYLGVDSRETQHGPIMLTDSLESACVYPFLQRNFEDCQHQLSSFANFAEACVIVIIFYCSPAIFVGLLKQNFALLRRSGFVVWVSVTSQI